VPAIPSALVCSRAPSCLSRLFVTGRVALVVDEEVLSPACVGRVRRYAADGRKVGGHRADRRLSGGKGITPRDGPHFEEPQMYLKL